MVNTKEPELACPTGTVLTDAVLPLAENALLTDRIPAELLVYDDACNCPYIQGQIARMPLRLPVRPLLPHEFDRRLASGDRRHGVALYTPTCPDCRACEPIRIDTSIFEPSKTHRRTLRAGDRLLTLELGPPVLSRSRIELYEKHLVGRGLSNPDYPSMTLSRYRGFIVDRFCDTFEIRLFLAGVLVAVAVTDRGADALSAHYTFYDPQYSKLSLGTYAILKQIEFARARGMRHVYLGLYIENNAAMRYKGRFHPHERRIDGKWTAFS